MCLPMTPTPIHAIFMANLLYELALRFKLQRAHL